MGQQFLLFILRFCYELKLHRVKRADDLKNVR